jgi:riboflavin biosynthesis pyrimidine reductase
MRALLPHPVAEVDVHEHYARHWLDRGGVRANFVSSADGAVTVAGRSRGLQTPGDKRVFAALRDLADVVLVGAGTAREEGYVSLALSSRRRALRAGIGLAELLPVAVVSRSLRLDPVAHLLTGDHPRTIVLTGATSDPDARARLDGIADVVVCGDDAVDLGAARSALAERGLTRILCEGGPTLFAAMARAGLVEELCLSLSPQLAGPGPGRIVSGPSWPLELAARHELALDGLLEEDGALFCRYAIRR